MIPKDIKKTLSKAKHKKFYSETEKGYIKELISENITASDLKHSPEIMEQLFPGRNYNSVRAQFTAMRG